MVSNVFLGLGSNIGDREKIISNACDIIRNDADSELLKVSSYYETSPYGNIDQNNFLNAVIEIKTNLNVEKLYRFVKEVETKLGRKKREIKWGPREIDIDILFYNDLIYKSDRVVIPHPEILNRDFVIVPMTEIAPDFVHPAEKVKISEIDISQIEKHIISKS
ncbi:MAG: 2-amino-4-hydroxy-6-hydroxymethyldihydropteridine diphosphokinase [Bacteroidota bacterium]